MSFNAKRRDPFRYFVVAFLILALFIYAFLLYLRNSKINGLKSDITKLTMLQKSYSEVDSCIYILYQAENNSRMYAVTADKYYLNQFSDGIRRISLLLNDLHGLGDNNPDNDDLKGLVNQKKLKTESYLKLRQLTDSLFAGFSKLGLEERRANAKINLNSIKKKFKTVTTVDTIKQAAAAPRKKFFGRIADAISNKSGKDSAVTIIKTKKNEGVVDEVTNFNNKLLDEVEAYYRKLYANNHQIKSNEKAILLLNNKLINDIIAVLKEFKQNDIEYIAKRRVTLGGELEGELKKLNGMELIDALLLVSLAAIILYNLYKLYKNESLLIAMNGLAAQDSHSKSRFLANMSHEIRTPLNSVVGFSEQLGKSKLNDEQREQVNAIRNSSEMLLELVNEILDFSKYEVGKINIESEPFSPEHEIAEVFHSMNVLAENKGLRFENKISIDKEVYLIGDRLRLKQVIMNLLTNAIKFTKRGKITLRVQLVVDGRKQAMLKVQVEDTGVGMAQEDLDVIFLEFSQIYSSAKTQLQGTGLGLAICKKIVELQGGKINVSSVLGKGSVFSFEIPYLISEFAQELRADAGIVSVGKLTGKRVLLVDDNKMNILLVQTILKRWNMEYDSAYDGKEALELYKKKDYDIVLTDIQMPVMGGVELTHEIRYNGDFAKSRIPILGITAHVMQENREAYLKAGMNDLVLKPFLEQELMDQMVKYMH
nr:ATP-binding protein [Pedobacter panaciterrae]